MLPFMDISSRLALGLHSARENLASPSLGEMYGAIYCCRKGKNPTRWKEEKNFHWPSRGPYKDPAVPSSFVSSLHPRSTSLTQDKPFKKLFLKLLLKLFSQTTLF